MGQMYSFGSGEYGRLGLDDEQPHVLPTVVETLAAKRALFGRGRGGMSAYLIIANYLPKTIVSRRKSLAEDSTRLRCLVPPPLFSKV